MTSNAATTPLDAASGEAAVRVATRLRDLVRVTGPDAESYLNRMLSNDVAKVPVKGSQDALLLTAKARVIAPVRLVRRAVEEVVLLTAPPAGSSLTPSPPPLPSPSPPTSWSGCASAPAPPASASRSTTA